MKRKHITDRKFDAFIIYETSTGKNLSEHLKDSLKKIEINAFVASKDLAAGVEEEEVRYSALRDSKYIFLLITNLSLAKPNEIVKEIRKAIKFGKERNIKPYRMSDVKIEKVNEFFKKLGLKKRQCPSFENMYELANIVTTWYLSNKDEILTLLSRDGPIKTSFVLKYSEHIDEEIKERILRGEVDDGSKALLDDYLHKISENDPKYNVLLHLMYSDYFHLRDQYVESEKEFKIAKKLAGENRIRIEYLLVSLQISYGHILVHLNDLERAKNIFRQSILKDSTHPILKARDIFRLGEILVFQGQYVDAIEEFNESITICNGYINDDLSKSAYHILADDYRKMGTAFRLKGDYERARKCYNTAKSIYNVRNVRGKVWLLHGIAELYRAKGNLNGALKMYEDAKKASQKVFNINRVAHAYLGICEVNRMKRQIDMNDFMRPLQIYKEIGSEWGVASIYISQSLSYISQNKEREKVEELLTRAENICQKLNLSEELKLISRIREGSRDELHPLSFF